MAKKKATRKKVTKKKAVENHASAVAENTPTKSVAKAKQKKSQADESKKPDLTRKERFLNAVFRPKLLVAAGLLGAGWVVGPSLFKLMPDLSNRSEYRLATADIEIPPPPRWVPVNLVQQVIDRSSLDEHVFVLEKDLAQRISKAFAKHPWVQGDVKVLISVPAKIKVDFKYRQPIAMVAVGDGYYPVDGEGALLPSADFPPSDIGLYPVITGFHSQPERTTGQRWGDARIEGAARLAVILTPFWEEWQLESIEIPKRESQQIDYNDLIFTVNTKGGSKIVWGRAPGHDHPLEITDDQKIGRVKSFLAKGKTLDGSWEININHFMEISRRPLNAG